MTQVAMKKRVKLCKEEREQRNKLLEKMSASGDLDRLRTSMYAQLLLQEPWQEEMKEATRTAVKSSGGIPSVTVDELANRIAQPCHASIPATLEEDIKRQIKQICFDS
eukprot:Nitzschia sp. Nitz4//scaffold11_size288233//13116//13524//NITZ4_000726-RA/size288233-snap-gene-0.38-mRNA-1//-1//CDS//3329533930//4515//frame0